jgi:mono/diheme cytochrome c family protein
MAHAFRFLLLAVLLAACGGKAKPAAPPPPPPENPPSADNPPPKPGPTPEELAKAEEEKKAQAAQAEVDAQVEAGKAVYGASCAGCHGDNGEGGKKAPAVVGKDALPQKAAKGAKKRKGVEFKTAGDVFAWVKKNMPAKKPGSLSDDDYAAVLAFDLKANGVDLKKKVDPASAAEITLHP